MSRSLTLIVLSAVMLGQVLVAQVAFGAGGGHGFGGGFGYHSWGGHFGGHGWPGFYNRFGRFGGPNRFNNQAIVPGEIIGTPFGYDDPSLLGGAYPGQACYLERRPVNTLYGLGWRTFSVCLN
jgi:hypothetical protein